ncbi:hypothetical protein Sa4125_35160 [Aureimonas sp. SA4125]|uniref:DUF2946 family protein n=1 Tax=Aureimonas sp. SA4125 TaxID=2826993 RepID=UPI001CC5467D|nr:hypothetical protein [Aureimonas sp. SA4125]BDA85974.1 hypothetical protein Sa4125_35160 [Aureimonas sp. SA4125]
MSHRGRTAATWATRLAACLFLVQTLLLAVNLGAHAAPRLVDQFGNVICTDGHPGQMPMGQKGSHDGQDACCLAACSAASNAHLLTPPTVMGLAIVRSAPLRRLQSALEDRRAGIADTPRSSRGPPVAV